MGTKRRHKVKRASCNLAPTAAVLFLSGLLHGNVVANTGDLASGQTRSV